MSFVQNIAPAVVASCVNTGVFASVVIAQAIEESAAGRSPQAVKGNNLFGHKASSTWAGKTMQTVAGGALWRVYGSVSDSINAHIGILKRMSAKLAGAFKVKTPYEQTAALQKSGYDAGPDRAQYAQKLNTIISALNLQQYDQQQFALERQKNPNKLAYKDQPALTLALHNIIG